MIVVTGGAGFIGSNIIKGLNKIGYKNILLVDNMKNGIKYKNLVHLDICDYIDKKDFLEKINTGNNLSDIEIIFHEGACSSTTEWDGEYIMKNNYHYSKILLHCCINNKIPFLYASSASVYGNRTNDFIEERKYETPLNMYSYSKFLFDQYVRSLLPCTKTQICGLRYFNVYGPGEHHKNHMASIIFNLNNQINHNENVKLFIGSDHFKRDFIYIDDVVAVNLWMWHNNISGIFNCGTGKATSFKDIADIILNFYKLSNLQYTDFPKSLNKYYQIFTQANLTQLRNVGYKKLFKNINQGILEYITWLNCKN